MGEVSVEVKLENAFDRERHRMGEIPEDRVRSATVSIVADSGAVSMYLPQDLVEALGLTEMGRAIVTYADDRREERPVAGIVTVRVGNRTTSGTCIVGPPAAQPLLGQVPLELMDLLVDCKERTLRPRPESPYLPLLNVK